MLARVGAGIRPAKAAVLSWRQAAKVWMLVRCRDLAASMSPTWSPASRACRRKKKKKKNKKQKKKKKKNPCRGYHSGPMPAPRVPNGMLDAIPGARANRAMTNTARVRHLSPVHTVRSRIQRLSCSGVRASTLKTKRGFRVNRRGSRPGAAGDEPARPSSLSATSVGIGQRVAAWRSSKAP